MYVQKGMYVKSFPGSDSRSKKMKVLAVSITYILVTFEKCFTPSFCSISGNIYQNLINVTLSVVEVQREIF